MDWTITARSQVRTPEVMRAMKARLSEALNEIATDARDEAKRLVKENSYSEGHLNRSIKADLGDVDEKIVFSGSDDPKTGKVDEWVEFGTRPHWMPKSAYEEGGALYGWVRLNLHVRATPVGGKEYAIKAKKGSGYRKVRAKTAREQAEVRRVAFLVARKIAREGIAPKPFMRPAMMKAEREGPDIIAEHMRGVGL